MPWSVAYTLIPKNYNLFFHTLIFSKKHEAVGLWVHVESTKKAQVRACANNNILQGEYIMNLTEKQVVFYSAEKDGFLEKYKDRDTLAFEAGFSEDLKNALSMPIESYEDQKDELDKLAEAFGCEVLNVEAEYNVTKPDGSDFERTEREEVTRDEIKAFLKMLIN